MEKEHKLGSIYGSRISKNGKWLNLTIVTEINGEKHFITCPVRIVEEYDGSNKKPIAQIGLKVAQIGQCASIYDIPVYEDSKPQQEEPADEDIPF